jgi:hypothetical protein
MAAESGRDREAGGSAGGGVQPDVSLAATSGAELSPRIAWSRRVRRVGGLIQTAFAAFWLIRGSHALGGAAEVVLIALSAAAVLASFAYAARVTAGSAPRPRSAEGKRIERAVTLATVIELIAAFVLPILVSAAGHSDWVLPSIAITIGPLLLYLDRLVDIPRYRPVGWALTVGPVILVAALSGTALVATTGIAAGVLMFATALAGFRDLEGERRKSQQAAAAELALAAAAGAQL